MLINIFCFLNTVIQAKSEWKMEMVKLHNNLTSERNKLQMSYMNLSEEREQLQMSFSNLSEEQDQLQKRFEDITNERNELEKRLLGNNLSNPQSYVFGKYVCRLGTLSTTGLKLTLCIRESRVVVGERQSK